MSDEVSALPGELDGLSAGDGLPVLAEGLASSVWDFGGDVAGSFVQAAARKNSMTLKAASKFRNRVVFIVVSSLPEVRSENPEFRSQKSEVRSQKSEVRIQKAASTNW
jgi:hypothetical protein